LKNASANTSANPISDILKRLDQVEQQIQGIVRFFLVAFDLRRQRPCRPSLCRSDNAKMPVTADPYAALNRRVLFFRLVDMLSQHLRSIFAP
jgi:hypothetical protein